MNQLAWREIASAAGYDNERAMFIAADLAGVELQAIADICGCTPATIRTRRNKCGLPPKPHGGARRENQTAKRYDAIAAKHGYSNFRAMAEDYRWHYYDLARLTGLKIGTLRNRMSKIGVVPATSTPGAICFRGLRKHRGGGGRHPVLG